MKTVHFAFTLLALSMVAAFPLIGESFAQISVANSDELSATAKVTAPNQITIEFSAPIMLDGTDHPFHQFTLTDGSFPVLADGTFNALAPENTRSVSSYNHIKDQMVFRLNISGDPLPTDAVGWLTLNYDGTIETDGIKVRVVDSTDINADPSSDITTKRLQSVTGDPSAGNTGYVTDGQAPQIISVKIIDNTIATVDVLSKPQVEIVYTEAVVATVSNYDYRGLNVNSVQGRANDAAGTLTDIAPNAGASTHILTLSGSPLAPETTGTVTFKPTYEENTDPKVPNGLIDIATNLLVATTGHPLINHPAVAAQIPTVESAMFTGSHEITIVFSEPILIGEVNSDSFTSITLDDGTTRNPATRANIEVIDDTNDTSYTLMLSASVPTGARGTMTIDPIMTTGDSPTATYLKDGAGNAVKMRSNYPIMDGQPPTISSKMITGPNELTVKFSEPVKASVKNFGPFCASNNGTACDLDSDIEPIQRTLSNLSGSNTDTITMKISGEEISTSASGLFTAITNENPNYDESNTNIAIAGIIDLADKPKNTGDADLAKKPNTIVAVNEGTAKETGLVDPGQTPKIVSAKIISPTTVHIVFTEPIQIGDGTAFDVSDAVKFYHGNNRANLLITGTTAVIASVDTNGVLTPNANEGSTIVLTFPDAPFSPESTGFVTITNAITSAINDGTSSKPSLKFIGVERHLVEAGQIPMIESIKITGPTQITVEYSEMVTAGSANFTKFTLTGGTDITVGETRMLVQADPGPSTPSDNKHIHTFTIDGDNLPTDATGTINITPTDGFLDDSDDIQVAAKTGYVVTDGQNPNLDSATLTAPNQVTLKFSEDIIAVSSDFTNFLIGGSSRNLNNFSGSGTNTITLTIGGAAIAPDAVAMTINIESTEVNEDDEQSSLVDIAGNPLVLTALQTGAVTEPGAVPYDDDGDEQRNADTHGFKLWPIEQGQTPMVTKASITASNQVTVEFSIPVNAVRSDFTFTLDGENTPRSITGISGVGSDTIILTVSGDKIPPEVSGRMDYAGTIVGSVSGVALDADVNQLVGAGQVPTVTAARITGPNTVTVTFDVAVTVNEENFTFTVDGESEPRGVDSAQQANTDGVVEVILKNTDTDDVNDMMADATGKIDINGVKNSNTGIVMESLTGYPVTDGQAPTVSTAKITDNNTVTIKFTERVHTTTNDYSNFMLTAGTGITTSESREIVRVTHPTGDTVVLNIDGDTIPVDATGTIDIAGNVTDLTENDFVAVSAYVVEAGQIPEVVSAMFTGPGIISVKFSEPVNADTDDFRDFKVTSDATDLRDAVRSIVSVDGTSNNSDTIDVIVLGPFDIDATATIDIEKEITDLATPPNALANRIDDQPVSHDQRPSIMSAAITDSNTITIKFSEPVVSGFGDYTDLKITYVPTDNNDDSDKITKSINIATVDNPGTDTAIITVRDTIPQNATGTIDLIASKYAQDSNSNKTYTSMVDNRGQILKELTSTSDETNTYDPEEEPYPINEQPYVMNNDYSIRDDRNSQVVSDLGVITGVVFSDDNGNGVRDTGEMGIRTSLTVIPSLPITYGSGLDGSYSIPNIPVDTYTISVASQTGYAPASPQTVTVEGDKTKTVNFALKPLVTITGTVFDDANDNDVKDTDEMGILNVTVSINTTPVKTGMTDDMGIYTISDVPAGSYTISVSGSGYDGITQTVNVMGGSTDPVDFALGSVGMVTGTVSDNMGMGIEDVSVSISGITNPVMTNDMGVYSFDSVPTGSKTITITVPENYIGDNIMSVTVGSGSNDPVDFTLVPVGMVTGTVSTSTGDGISVDVRISDADDNTIGTGMTDDAGTYSIGMIPVGDYDVTITLPDGYFGTASMPVTISHGASETVNFDLMAVGTITGTVFNDMNEDDNKDALETGLANVTVSLMDTDFTAMTDENGIYTISNVPVGEYVLSVPRTDDYFDAAVSVTVRQGDTTMADIPLAPITEETTATISGVIFNDTNGDGMQDANERGYGPYSEMILTNTDTNVQEKMDTDTDGTYSFVVHAGNTYTIQTSFFPAGVTVLDPASSWYRENITPTAGQTVTFDVGFHTVMEDEYSMLDLTVFIDANSNGVMDEGETGQPLLFTVYTYTIGPANVTTDAQGKLLHKLVPADWAITGLPAGYAPTLYSYERDDSTTGKVYDSAILVADDPEPGSTHTMIIGLVPTS